MTYFDFCFHRSTTVPPLQIRLPKRKDRLPTMNFQRLCLLQGVHYRFLEIPLKRLSKIKIQKPWLAKRKVLQVPHLAKLLANNNSVKVWIILDLKKNNPLLKFFLQQSWKWFQGSFWGLGSHLPGPCDPLPWFWGKNQLLSENLLFSTPKKPNHVVSRNRGGFFFLRNCPKVCLLCPCFPSDSGERRGVGHLRHAQARWNEGEMVATFTGSRWIRPKKSTTLQ